MTKYKCVLVGELGDAFPRFVEVETVSGPDFAAEKYASRAYDDGMWELKDERWTGEYAVSVQWEEDGVQHEERFEIEVEYETTFSASKEKKGGAA